MGCLGLAGKVIIVSNWKDLPDVVKPGVYKVDGVTIRVREPTEKEELVMFVKGVKKLADEYYG